MLKQCSIHTERVLHCKTRLEFGSEVKVWLSFHRLRLYRSDIMVGGWGGKVCEIIYSFLSLTKNKISITITTTLMHSTLITFAQFCIILFFKYLKYLYHSYNNNWHSLPMLFKCRTHYANKVIAIFM